MKIIRAALRRVVEFGADSLTLEEVARTAKLKRSHVSYYFKSKRELLLACIECITREAAEYLDRAYQEKDGSEENLPLDRYVSGQLRWMDEFPAHRALFFLFFHYATLDADAGMFLIRFREYGEKRLLGFIGADPRTRDLGVEDASDLKDLVYRWISGELMYVAATTATNSGRLRLDLALKNLDYLLRTRTTKSA